MLARARFPQPPSVEDLPDIPGLGAMEGDMIRRGDNPKAVVVHE